MAREHGIEGFCYWHYWFGGEQLLERPFNEVLASGKPDFPFCLSWANQTWTGIWHGAPNRILKQQTYPGMEDHRRHFEFFLPAFRDRRYIRVNDKPLLVVFEPKHIPDCRKVTDFWRELANQAGLPGLHLVATYHDPHWSVKELGFDAVTCTGLFRAPECEPWLWRTRQLRKMEQNPKRQRVHALASRHWNHLPNVYAYADVWPKLIVDWQFDVPYLPNVIPNWDNTPRSHYRGLVLQDGTPELFRQHLQTGIRHVAHLPPEERIVFLKSWNEWAEGNYLEPDQRFGRGYLEAVRAEANN